MCGKIAGALALLMTMGGMALAQTPPAVTTKNEVCAGCHEQEKKLAKAAHASVACAACHLKHEEFPHPEGIAKPGCSQCHANVVNEYAGSVHATESKSGNAAAPKCDSCHGDVHENASARTAEGRKGIMDTCGMCHADESEHFKASIHGQKIAKGFLEAATCSDCHAPHAIQRVKNKESRVHPLHVAETCARCHGQLKLTQRFGAGANAVATFNESFHGLALKSGMQTVASCASCHGFHDILPSTDKRSKIHPKNIAKTCGACHKGAGETFAIGPVHTVDARSLPPAVRYAQLFYLLVIPGTIGLMLLHHGGDFLRKLAHMRFLREAWAHSVKPPAHEEIRMERAERIQHGLLAVSFIVLCHSGFALHYPDAWWSRPFLEFEKNYPIRGTVHRVAAAVMVGASILHVWSIIASRHLRARWKGFFPKVSDVREAIDGMLWAFGLKKHKPYRSAHSYIEKAEYWAVVWGTFVMAVSGAMLWANDWTLRYLPKWWIDFARTVHFYEAVLAALSILVWHFYMVIFDPEVYPMDTAWYNGKSPRRHAEHGPAASHESEPAHGD